jgi:hypothetical protein
MAVPESDAQARAPPVTSVLKNGDVPENLEALSDDEAALAALGYKQEFKREFSAWTTFAVSFAVMGLLPSIASTMWYGMGYGALMSPHRGQPVVDRRKRGEGSGAGQKRGERV